MGVGIIGLIVLAPAIAIALAAALWCAISAARAGHTLTVVASLASLLMIASPFALAAFAPPPQPDEENPIFLIEYGIFPSALLAVVTWSAGIVLRRRYRWLAATTLLLAGLAFMALTQTRGPATTSQFAGGYLQWLGSVGLLALAAYPVIWVFAFRELSEYVTPRLAKPQQG